MALYHFTAKPLSRGPRNTVRAIAYRAGCKLYDTRTGESFNYQSKWVEHVELLLPKEAPQWAVDIQNLIAEDRQNGVQAFIDIVEAAEKRINSRVWREFEFALHRELTEAQNIFLAREFVEDQICSRGMAAQLNFHFDVDAKTGEEKPHCHVVVTTRRLEETGMGAKERDWNQKALLCDLREKWQEYSNFHLKLHGHDIQIDHRSNKERGIDMETQPKQGKGIIELEKRIQKLEGEERTSFVTDKAKAFHDIQLRNLYRIMRRPEVVFDIVTKHHSTFMWADVQKKLHQYIDEAPLFERLEAKLKSSRELILLRFEEVKNSNGVVEERAVYTTRNLLKAERALVKSAEDLITSKSHGVEKKHIEDAISNANEREELKRHGGLSQDQVTAIYHLVEEGQIKCVIGIAGAGKTTALGVCHDIWENGGYAVYGLAPTGKAAQNLEQSGISSSTLHKFLKSFEEGRCQYNDKSVLILDEAGMVDVERFEKLLGAVKKLGVKLIVVGDGAQLQPVEAGPAFRLIIERTGKSELHTVIRQKEEWQKEATVLFGKQNTREAIQKYADKGWVHIVDEKLPSLKKLLAQKDYEGVVNLYNISSRVSSLLYREMAKDVKKEHPHISDLYPLIKTHQDFDRYLEWKDREKEAAFSILNDSETYRSLLEERSIDPFKMALLFVNKKNPKAVQHEKAISNLKNCGLDHLIGAEKQIGQRADVRQEAKEALIKAWQANFKETPEKSTAILAYSNRDVNDLNKAVRSLLKESGHISKKEFVYTVKKEVEDDFGRKAILKEEKAFSKGDQIVFTRNTNGLGVKNGSKGIISDLNQQNVRVLLDGGQEVSFSPRLNPYFDQGWAVTIHKSQGMTVDRTFLLASNEMTQNLAYVAMTRHREDIQVFGSSLDFWRPEKLPQVLSKSGEKLSAADYLDAESLNKLMEKDDHLLTKIFERVAGELDAMGTVSKKAFWNVADRFLGRTREKEIRRSVDSVREEVRAEELLQKKDNTGPQNSIAPNQLPSIAAKVIEREVKQKPSNAQSTETWGGIAKGQETKILEKGSPFENDQTKIKSEEGLQREGNPRAQSLRVQKQPFFSEAKVVEKALTQNIASFADDIFPSLGEPLHKGSSSSTQRRYGEKGHISVNLRTGAWIDFKNSELSGGPLHMLTKLKGLSFKEAVEYGASWAGLSSLGSSRILLKSSQDKISLSRKEEKEVIDAVEKTKIERAQSLWQKGKPIKGTLAERYLREHRKIEGELPQDLRYLPQYQDRRSGKSTPCLMAAARSPEGEVTAVQLTFLDSNTADKAKIDVAKRSFGILKGSFVTIQEDKSSNLIFIAEGVETALSLKEAGIKGTIKASLGLANIKRISLKSPETHIIICADHDAPSSPASKSLEKCVLVVQIQGYKVTVIKPDKLGEDFNDVLKGKGKDAIQEIFKRLLPEMAFQKEPHETPKGENSAFLKDTKAKNPLKKPPQNAKEGPKVTQQPILGKASQTRFPQGDTPQSKTFSDIEKLCQNHLYEYLKKENRPLTSEVKERVTLQAKKAAEFIFHTHTLKGTHPTQKETKHFLLRAKYELDRIPEIRKEIIKDWLREDHFDDKKHGLIAHMIAERQASIEGRLYLEAKRKGLSPPSHIADLAEKELKAHRGQAKGLAQKLIEKYALSERAATHCAKDILRYKETHGEKPTPDQVAHMAQIARELERKSYTHPSKEYRPHELAFLRRKEGDLLLRQMTSREREINALDCNLTQTQAKVSLEATALHITKELMKMNQKKICL